MYSTNVKLLALWHKKRHKYQGCNDVLAFQYKNQDDRKDQRCQYERMQYRLVGSSAKFVVLRHCSRLYDSSRDVAILTKFGMRLSIALRHRTTFDSISPNNLEPLLRRSIALISNWSRKSSRV